MPKPEVKKKFPARNLGRSLRRSPRNKIAPDNSHGHDLRSQTRTLIKPIPFVRQTKKIIKRKQVNPSGNKRNQGTNFEQKNDDDDIKSLWPIEGSPSNSSNESNETNESDPRSRMIRKSKKGRKSQSKKLTPGNIERLKAHVRQVVESDDSSTEEQEPAVQRHLTRKRRLGKESYSKISLQSGADSCMSQSNVDDVYRNILLSTFPRATSSQPKKPVVCVNLSSDSEISTASSSLEIDNAGILSSTQDSLDNLSVFCPLTPPKSSGGSSDSFTS